MKQCGVTQPLDYDVSMARDRHRYVPMVAVAILVPLVWFASGCSALGSCDRSDASNPPDPYHDGTAVDGFYMSSDWTGPLLPFPGGKRYQFFHGLGVTPREMACWASFNSTGIHNGSIAHPAGNMCVVQEINSEFIQIKNDTCSDMYVMVTASAPWATEDSTESQPGETP